MSDELVDPRDGKPVDAVTLLARAAAADLRGHRRSRAAAAQVGFATDFRMEDRTRAALEVAMHAAVAGMDAAIREPAARLLTMRGERPLAVALSQAPDPYDRVVVAGLFEQGGLFDELYARTRLALLADALPVTAADDPERPSLLARLGQAGDRIVATAAIALLGATARRVEATAPAMDLPAMFQRQLGWWVAAALRETLAGAAGARLSVLDRALAESVRRAVDPADAPPRLESAAMRLAVAIDAQPEELPGLVLEAVADQRLALFVALLAHAADLQYERVRAIVIDPDAERLWTVLRALHLGRGTIARIGFALCEAEPGRDIEGFADMLDSIVAIDPAAARAAMAPLALDADYHAAVVALANRAAR